jgi:uncharacterized protein
MISPFIEMIKMQQLNFERNQFKGDMFMRALQRIALTLVIIGAINWGLIGLFNFDLVAAIFGGQDAFLSRVIYSLVGLSGLICLTLLFKQWESTSTNEVANNRSNFGRPNYGTEFGEETDVSNLKNSTREDE